jgi:hypothetical protein
MYVATNLSYFNLKQLNIIYGLRVKEGVAI